jgi:hypothetical protein
MEPYGKEHSFCPQPATPSQACSQREDVYKHFRFTPRTTRIVLFGFLFVPSAILYTSAMTDVRSIACRATPCTHADFLVEMELGRETEGAVPRG